MQYRRMGRSGLKVSALTLGTLWFGSKVDEITAVEIIDRALAAGINCVDTADIYGKERWDTPERGPAEEIVGRALKGRRSSVVLATKVAAITGPGANDRGLSRKHIFEGIHEVCAAYRPTTSTSTTCTNRLRDTAEESLEALDDLVRQARSSTSVSPTITPGRSASLVACGQKGPEGVDCIQMVYNLGPRRRVGDDQTCEAKGSASTSGERSPAGSVGRYLALRPRRTAAGGGERTRPRGSPYTSRR